MNINYVANGLGAQSMYLLYLASQRVIPATVSITADTGWEDDSDMCDGTKTTASAFFRSHVEPFAAKHGIAAYFVRSVDRDGSPLPALGDRLAALAEIGTTAGVPLFGSQGGRQIQSCTDKWKIRAMKQQARRLGATHARSAQGIHYGEAARRVKGEYIGSEDGYSIYKPVITVKGVPTTIKWMSHYYPLVDLKMAREDVKEQMDWLGIPYLTSSECSGCPHADAWRWLRRTPGTIERVAQIEDKFNGAFFFTDRRRPLRDVIAEMRAAAMEADFIEKDQADFGCTNGVCGE